MTHRIFRWLYRFIAIVLLLSVGYVVVINSLLQTDIFKKLINRNPDNYRLDYSFAWSIIPGVVSFDDFDLWIQTSRNRWEISSKQGVLYIDLLSLLKRQFHTYKLTAKGLKFGVQRTEKLTAVESPKYPDAVPPPISSSQQLPNKTKLSSILDPYVDGQSKPRWSIWLENATIDQLQHIVVNEFKLSGVGQVRGALFFEVRGKLIVRPSTIKMNKAQIYVNERLVGDQLDLQTSVQSDAFVPRLNRGKAKYKYLSGHISARGHSVRLGILNEFTKNVESLVFNGRGSIDADLNFSNGVLIPGSQLKVISPDMDVAYDDYVANGSGIVNISMSNESVSKPIDMQVRLQKVKVAPKDSLRPLISGIGLDIDLKADSFAIESGLGKTTLKFNLPKGTIPDITELNTFLQGRAGIKFVSGQGDFSGVFTANAGSGFGQMDVKAKSVIASYKEVPLSSDIHIHAQVADSNIRSTGFDISGSFIHFDKVAVRNLQSDKHNQWWGRLNLDQASVTSTKPLAVNADVGVEMYDTRPLLALFDKTTKHRWLQSILTIKDIQGRAKVYSDKTSITFNPLTITGKKLQLNARFRISDKINGIIYTRLRGIQAGMEIKDNISKMIFLGSKKRFETHPEIPYENPDNLQNESMEFNIFEHSEQ